MPLTPGTVLTAALANRIATRTASSSQRTLALPQCGVVTSGERAKIKFTCGRATHNDLGPPPPTTDRHRPQDSLVLSKAEKILDKSRKKSGILIIAEPSPAGAQSQQMEHRGAPHGQQEQQ
ncbi:PREDICTED: uncharacterized protein LOC108768380 [Trachymyrmex cornetzi]|uniref:uncharacterized protein LOC108768380 n=1 Tax=Trachymyrmex cornetzi TaxID=471704 RepID=UPI00084F763B|nr:PREDICTED: uncharacterized protein LOC108768380 [Trachymyrmex cornetzi]